MAMVNCQLANAQRQWTLDECVQYATEHSNEVLRKILELEISKNDLNTAQNEWMPTVSATVGQQFSFGNALASTGVMPSTTSEYNADLSFMGGSIGMEMPLFDGFLTRSRRRAAHWQVEQATASLAHVRKNLAIQVATYYLQVLYEQGMADVAQAQVETTRQLCEMTRSLVDEGRNPKSDMADAEAQLADDEYLLTECQGRVRTSLLNLAQLLNLDTLLTSAGTGTITGTGTRTGTMALLRPSTLRPSATILPYWLARRWSRRAATTSVPRVPATTRNSRYARRSTPTT